MRHQLLPKGVKFINIGSKRHFMHVTLLARQSIISGYVIQVAKDLKEDKHHIYVGDAQ